MTVSVCLCVNCVQYTVLALVYGYEDADILKFPAWLKQRPTLLTLEGIDASVAKIGELAVEEEQ